MESIPIRRNGRNGQARDETVSLDPRTKLAEVELALIGDNSRARKLLLKNLIGFGFRNPSEILSAMIIFEREVWANVGRAAQVRSGRAAKTGRPRKSWVWIVEDQDGAEVKCLDSKWTLSHWRYLNTATSTHILHAFRDILHNHADVLRHLDEFGCKGNLPPRISWAIDHALEALRTVDAPEIEPELRDVVKHPKYRSLLWKGRIYLSYADIDSEHAKSIHSVWSSIGAQVVDRHECVAGSRLLDYCNMVLPECNVFAVCFSNNTRTKNYAEMKTEFDSAVKEYKNRKVSDSFIVPVCFSRCRIPKWILDNDPKQYLNQLVPLNLFKKDALFEDIKPHEIRKLSFQFLKKVPEIGNKIGARSVIHFERTRRETGS